MLASLALAASLTMAAAPYGPTPPPSTHSPTATAPCPEPPGRMSPSLQKSNRRLAIAGSIVFGVFYAAGSAVAAVELDATRHAEDIPSVRDRRRIAYLMFVPVFGPFVATPLGRTKGERAAYAGYGIMQAWGLAMLGSSVFALARHRRAQRRLALSGAATARGGFVTVRGRF